MANKQKPAAPAATPAAPAALANMVTVLAAQPAAPVPAVAVLVPATYAGVPSAQLTKTQLGFATAKHAPSMPKVAGALTVVGAKAYRVRSGNNAAWWQAMQQAGCASAAGASPAALAAAVQAGTLCPKFLGYAVKNRWVVPA